MDGDKEFRQLQRVMLQKLTQKDKDKKHIGKLIKKNRSPINIRAY